MFQVLMYNFGEVGVMKDAETGKTMKFDTFEEAIDAVNQEAFRGTVFCFIEVMDDKKFMHSIMNVAEDGEVRQLRLDAKPLERLPPHLQLLKVLLGM
jgi:hypothetical protein